MPFRLNAFCAFLLLFFSVGCGESQEEEPLPEGARLFRFALHGAGSEAHFQAWTDDEAIIATAREQLARPAESRNLFPLGVLELGNGGHNLGWSWHFTPSAWELAEVAIEVCDGTPSYVEEHLDEWLEQVGSYCPWSGYVLAELDPP